MAGITAKIDVTDSACGLSHSKALSIAVFTRFHPNVGGIETVAELLAREWAARGHRVTIVTDVAAAPNDNADFPFPVLYRPGPLELLRVVRNCDVVVHNNISVKVVWPLLLARKPFVAANHDRYDLRPNGTRPWKERTKVWIARHWAYSTCVSYSTQDGVGCHGPVIHNPYNHRSFRNFGARRDKDLVFLGRLVSDKGVNVLLDALAELKRQHFTPSLTIVGNGPERESIELQIRGAALENQVTLGGHLHKDEVVAVLNEHKIMVVPSVYPEGFGVVALEGIACGCVIVGSKIGGLPEAIGPCGVTFPMGDHRRLAAILVDLLADPTRLEPYRAAAPEHLAMHRVEPVATRYLDFFREVLDLLPPNGVRS